ncbi:MAG: suppressor of fused domain protein [Polyangiaceae bacterium]|nr:suppressor of fused domain protein [Polyangiaceae bacterium]
MEKLWQDYLEKRAARPAPDYDANAYDELRAPAYQQSFGGTALSVVTLPIPTPPFVVNVHVYDEPPPRDPPLVIMPGALEGAPPSSPARTFTTLATLGMSNERMAVPSGTPADCCRVELALYLDHEAVAENRDLIAFGADVLLHYAKYPFLEDTFLAPTQVVPVCVIGQGRVAFLDDPTISAFLLLPPRVRCRRASSTSI